MLQVGLSWCWIGISAWLWGYAGIRIINGKKEDYDKSWDILMVLGICFLTVFAQFFSLFYKVGEIANIVLFMVNIIIAVTCRKELIKIVTRLLLDKSNRVWIIVFFVLALVMSNITSGNIRHYDTNLYHAQSIHWIEEYGIVPGVGNLHNRLAYNSSFFCLQALFSFKFINGESLHSMNGFCVFILLSYAVCSFKYFRGKRLFASDFLRLGMVCLFNYAGNTSVISSSGSDLLALGLIFYIFIKWVTYLEEGVEGVYAYALLCLLGVYAVSVKLSTAMIVLLTIMPAIRLIQNREWKAIIKYISMGLIIILPFLIRNVIISGYLIYPYPELDLFEVDWKMPSFTLYFDRYEIQAWGRGLNDVFRFDATMDEWFMQWLEYLPYSMRFFFFATVILGIYGLVKGMRLGIKNSDWNYLLILFTAFACFVMWFVGAPLARYGSAFLLIVPLYVIGEEICNRIHSYPKYLSIIIAVVILSNMYTMFEYVVEYPSSNFIESSEYEDLECYVEVLGDEDIYIPVEDDRVGYYDFPSTPYARRLKLIELRGNELSDGFRMKEEYRDNNISTYGDIYDVNIFE